MAGSASAYYVISKEVENQIFRRNWIFRQHVCINNPHWQSSGIIIFLCKYYVASYFRYTDRFFLGCVLFVTVIFSEFYEKPIRNKDWATEEST